MALESPIDWSTVEDAIYDWIFGATAISVDWSSEDRPEREFPYITLKSDVGIDFLVHRPEVLEKTNLANPAGEEIEITLANDSEFVVACECRTIADAPGGSARYYLQSAKAALGKPSVKTALRTGGVVVVEADPILDTDEERATSWTSGAVMEVRFRTLATVTEKTGYIAKVGVTGTFVDANGNTVPQSYTEDIPD